MEGIPMASDRIYNFSAGPSMLPLECLKQAASEITNFGGSGMSVMEMSHRSKVFLGIFEETKANFKKILQIPDQYSILFLQGGASLQFAMAPMNLISKTGKADYAITGNFSNLAYKEAKKYGACSVAVTTQDKNHTYIPAQQDIAFDKDASYFYYCANNTIYGTEWNYVPDAGPVPLVCDMSSNILSMPVDVSKFGLIFAGAQKNMAPAGLTVVIIRNDLPGNELPYTPVMMNYATMIEKDSMYNTPSCYNIYMLGLVLKWVEKLGGIPAMEQLKKERASLLYDYIDNSKLFHCPVEPTARSGMNVVFVTGDKEKDAQFASEATKAGFVNLAGHRSVGGMRASVYNAMPVEGVQKLVTFMKDFELKNS
jgi:phosphoserine aminotransferase